MVSEQTKFRVTSRVRQAAWPRPVAILALLLATAHGVHALTAPAVPLIVVQPGAAGVALELEALLEPQRQAVVAAQASGTLRTLAVQAGDRVQVNQLLARIDERELAAGLAGGDAAVAQAQATLLQARQHEQRTRELQDQGFIAAAALDTAQAQLKAAHAALAAAQANRQQAAVARGFAEVRAPFAGLVRATHAEPGDLAAPGRPLVTVYAPDKLRAVVHVPLSQAAAARDARRLEVQLPDGQLIQPARVTELPAADAGSQTQTWRLDLDAAAVARHALQPGTPVRVRFTEPAAASASAVPQRLLVPAAAVLRRGELTAVYVMQGDRFVLRSVRTGKAQGDSVPVLAGLRAGERIAGQAIAAGLTGAMPAGAR
jgi:RND family efflux transporter MFP subunit